MALKFTLFGNTNVGSVRDHNEDNFTVCADLSENLWSFSKDEARELSAKGALLVVADGMGGTNAGEVASDIAQHSIREAFEAVESVPEGQKERENLLKKFILDAHNKIVKHQEDNLETAGMGTTLVIAWVVDDMLHAAWSGDSRCYVLDEGQSLEPFTDDHSLVWDLVKKGDMTPEEARTHPNSNIINQSLGDPKSAPKPDAKSRKLYKGNRVLVCSDGLNGMISDEEMQSLLESGADVSQTCRDLVDAANAAGGHDNITCLLLDVKEGAAAPKGGVPTSSSRPTQTSVLRKKVKYNYAVIGILVAVVAVLSYFLFFNGEKVKEEKVNTHGVLKLDIYPGKDFEVDLSNWSNSIAEITEVRFGSGTYEIQGNSVVLKSPIDVADTLFVRYKNEGKKVLEERAFVFNALEGIDMSAPESGSSSPQSQTPPSRPESNSGENATQGGSQTAPETQTPKPVVPNPPADTPSTQRPKLPDGGNGTTQPKPQERPKLNPINQDTTSKE